QPARANGVRPLSPQEDGIARTATTPARFQLFSEAAGLPSTCRHREPRKSSDGGPGPLAIQILITNGSRLDRCKVNGLNAGAADCRGQPARFTLLACLASAVRTRFGSLAIVRLRLAAAAAFLMLRRA